MKETRNSALISLIYIVLFGLYHVCVFLLYSERTQVFWISYSFLIVALLAHSMSVIVSFKRAKMEAAFLSIPLILVSLLYLIAELVFSVTFMTFQGIGAAKAVWVQSGLLGVFAIIAIMMIMFRKAASVSDGRVKEDTGMVAALHADLEMLIHKSEDAELKAGLCRLAETVKYSDPMRNAAIEDVELRITLKFSELRDYYEAGIVEDARRVCREMELLFVERNKKLLINK